MKLPQVILDAFEIADHSARADVESGCAPVGQQMPPRYDLTKIDADCKAFVELAVRYLEARGLVRREEGNPNIVYFEGW